MSDHINPTEESCPKCGEETVSRCCGACGGDGYVELYEEDPNYYRPGDLGQCHDGLGLLFFPSSWTAEQKAEWLAGREPRYHGYTEEKYMIA